METKDTQFGLTDAQFVRLQQVMERVSSNKGGPRPQFLAALIMRGVSDEAIVKAWQDWLASFNGDVNAAGQYNHGDEANYLFRPLISKLSVIAANSEPTNNVAKATLNERNAEMRLMTGESDPLGAPLTNGKVIAAASHAILDVICRGSNADAASLAKAGILLADPTKFPPVLRSIPASPLWTKFLRKRGYDFQKDGPALTALGLWAFMTNRIQGWGIGLYALDAEGNVTGPGTSFTPFSQTPPEEYFWTMRGDTVLQPWEWVEKAYVDYMIELCKKLGITPDPDGIIVV